MIQLVHNTCQFGGSPNDDPNEHIVSFLVICDTQKHNGVSTKAIRLMLFSFSLKDKAKNWFYSLPQESISTWDEMASKFLAKYFPPSKSAKLHNDMTTFAQFNNESIYEAWKRYKGHVQKVPNHGLSPRLEIQFFYNGLNPNTKDNHRYSRRWSTNEQGPRQSPWAIRRDGLNNYQWQSERVA